MTTVVLLLLALIWGALLVSWLRSRTATTFSDSVGTFRRHLIVLERTTPGTVRPANRLYDARGVAALAGARAARSRAVAPGFVTGSGTVGRPASAHHAHHAAMRRRQAQKRRRDVFFALLAGAGGSLLLSLIPGLAVMWSVQVIFDLLLFGYCALLVRMRNAAAEREMKLRYMSAPRAVARPARRMRPTYDFGAAGYGDLELQRAAN